MLHIASQSPAVSELAEWRLQAGDLHATVSSAGAMLFDLRFTKSDGSFFWPFARADWRGDLRRKLRKDIPVHLQLLGGEWACVPFGKTVLDQHTHGFCTDHNWSVVTRSDAAITLRIDYPADHVVAAVERQIALDERGTSVDFTLTITPRSDCCLPIAFHPVFALPQEPGDLEVSFPGFSSGQSLPASLARAGSALSPDAPLTAAGEIRLADGSRHNMFNDLSPLNEELVQLWNTTGAATLTYARAQCQVAMEWDKAALPHCLIWVANPGLENIVDGAQFCGIGIEPNNSFFDVNDRAADFCATSHTHPSEFGLDLTAGIPWTTHYRIAIREFDETKGKFDETVPH
ncbi:hypothetical protein [Candidatus Halocynthiibacter alkanivorans]|uniref:hypothetical protein n=1 Tax=Candidatus Halocynthiibacter alkanivorans TaxID=2267619 RepID=UPI000DF36812|nr:hypothetical protein [Candidatus Halocynthiibacter alkanivorans]